MDTASLMAYKDGWVGDRRLPDLHTVVCKIVLAETD